MLLFVISIFVGSEAQTRWFKCRKVGLPYTYKQHSSKRQYGLEYMQQSFQSSHWVTGQIECVEFAEMAESPEFFDQHNIT